MKTLLKFSKVLLVVTIIYSCQSPSSSKKEGIQQEEPTVVSDSLKILKLEQIWVDVALDGDADSFAAMMANDYKGLYSSGRFGSKEPWVKAIKESKTIYNYVKIHDLSVYIYSNTAIVTGRFEQQDVKNGVEHNDSGSYLNTWARIDEKWILVASAFTDDNRILD